MIILCCSFYFIFTLVFSQLLVTFHQISHRHYNSYLHLQFPHLIPPLFLLIQLLSMLMVQVRSHSHQICYCRKTAVCNGDQLFDFSVLELVQSQSTFSTDPEVLQNCAGFTLCSSAGPAVDKCSTVMGLTPCMLCV